MNLKNKNLRKNARAFAVGICYNKTREWKHEKEWRIQASSKIDTKEQPGLYIPFGDPIAIYLGCLASEQLRKEMIDICRERKIELYEMYLVSNTFRMNYRKVELYEKK